MWFASSEEERDTWVRDLRWCALHTRVENSYEMDRVRPEGCLGTGSFSGASPAPLCLSTSPVLAARAHGISIILSCSHLPATLGVQHVEMRRL